MLRCDILIMCGIGVAHEKGDIMNTRKHALDMLLNVAAFAITVTTILAIFG
jgi:hypothetical protein